VTSSFICLCRPLRAFDLVKDRDTGNSKGYGFCIYEVHMLVSIFSFVESFPMCQ
jgi:hypothetical protein